MSTGIAYLDYVGSWGPMIHGHCYEPVQKAIRSVMDKGTSFGAPTAAEVELARKVTDAVPSVELLRLTSSGTEATMSAIRVARGATGRRKIVKFSGCYHGHVDSLLVRAGSGARTFGVPTSAGVPDCLAEETLVADFNDLDSLRVLIEGQSEDIAAIILEPVVGNMGVIPPREGFLSGLRNLCDEVAAVLIFDEVMTGFRLCYGGMQNIAGLRPDLSCFGKVVGGGLPLAAFGGSRELMEQLSPLGPVYQAGTLSGNPLAVAAGIAALRDLEDPSAYEKLEALGSQLEEGLRSVLGSYRKHACLNRVGSMWTLFFGVEKVETPSDAESCDTETYGRWFGEMLKRGIYLPPSQFEAAFISLAHREEDIENTIAAAREVLELL